MITQRVKDILIDTTVFGICFSLLELFCGFSFKHIVDGGVVFTTAYFILRLVK